MRKRRTREHIIADLSANHVERHALLCGYSVERVIHDYGIDLVTVHFRKSGLMDTTAMRLFARYKANVLNQRPENRNYDV